MSILKRVLATFRMPGVAWSFSRIGYRRHARRFNPTDLDVSLAGRHYAVTGANTGIGFAIAKALAKREAHVLMLCRNKARGEAARQQIAESKEASKYGSGSERGSVRLEVVDVADPSSIDDFLARVSLPRLDALIHNAGALVHERIESPWGVELTFACHVLGPHRLTHGLRSHLERAASENDTPRVIYASSGGMYWERLRVDHLLKPPQPFDGVRAYALAKRAQVVLAQQWAARWPHLRFFAMHPGWVDTQGVERALPRFYETTRRWLRRPEEGADTSVWLAASPSLDLENGAFVFDRAQAPRHLLPSTRADHSERSRLWEVVEDLALNTFCAQVV